MYYIEKLNQLRITKNLSFRELGLQCELSESCIKKIFYKNSNPLVSSIERICEVLGISTAELFCSENETVIKKSAETLKLISLCNSIPLKAKEHLLGFIKELVEQ